jgi:CRISPR/Cas system-associated exonuclease Cas4 (RecB family)
VVDYKTTADTRRDAAYALQLAVYAAPGRAEGLTVGGAHLHDLNAGERRPVDVTAPAVVEAVAQIAVNLHGMRRGAFVPKPEPGKCGNCDYCQVCRHAPATAL